MTTDGADIISLDERRSKIRISTDSDHLTVKGSSEVTLCKYVRFHLQGVEVGYLDARFDFKTMPEEYHGLALQCLLSGFGPVTMNLDNLVRAEQEEARRETPPPPPPRRWWQFWRR